MSGIGSDDCKSYKGLSPERREIRLLILTRASNALPAKCVLQTVSLDDCENYVALSYAWGNPNDTVPLEISGHVYQITLNLNLALGHLLQGAKRLVIWADSICINQTNLGERAEQVKMMGDIYRNDEHVLVWLGKEQDDSTLALRMIQTWGNAIYDRGSTRLAVESIEDPFEPRAWSGIALLLRRPWWDRLWTLQEVMLGKEVSIICGTTSISWNSLYHASRAWGDSDEISSGMHASAVSTIAKAGADDQRVIVRLKYWANKMSNTMDSDILELVSRCRDFSATDPRDKIYALMSLAEPLPGLEIDYLGTVEQTYTAFARTHIQHCQSLVILRHAGLGKLKRDLDTQLPSWVPDWRSPAGFSYDIPGLTHASLDTKATATVSFSQLSISGVVSDTIEVVEPPTKSLEEDGWVKLALTGSHLYEPTMIPRIQAYFRIGLIDWDYKAEMRLSPRSKYFFTLAITFCNFLVLFHRDCISAHIISFSEAMSISLQQAVLIHMLDQEDKETSDAYWAWEAAAPPPEEPIEVTSMSYARQTLAITRRQCFFVTANGYMGLGPAITEKGDLICVLYGCPVPVVLRRVDSGYLLVGECFVLGLMDGEALAADHKGVKTTFNIF